MERVRYKDHALWEFLDLFNHRFLSLFHRAWEKYRFPIVYESGGEDPFTEGLFALIGIGTAASAAARASRTRRSSSTRGSSRSARTRRARSRESCATTSGSRSRRAVRRAMARPRARGPLPARLEEQPPRSRPRLRRPRLEQPVPIPGSARPAELLLVPGLPATRQRLDAPQRSGPVPRRPRVRFRHPARPEEGGDPRVPSEFRRSGPADARLDDLAHDAPRPTTPRSLILESMN